VLSITMEKKRGKGRMTGGGGNEFEPIGNPEHTLGEKKIDTGKSFCGKRVLHCDQGGGKGSRGIQYIVYWTQR